MIMICSIMPYYDNWVLLSIKIIFNDKFSSMVEIHIPNFHFRQANLVLFFYCIADQPKFNNYKGMYIVYFVIWNWFCSVTKMNFEATLCGLSNGKGLNLESYIESQMYKKDSTFKMNLKF